MPLFTYLEAVSAKTSSFWNSLFSWRSAHVESSSQEEGEISSNALIEENQVLMQNDKEKPSQSVFDLLEAESWDSLEALLEEGANINQRDKSGRTMLHHAAKNNELAKVKRLIGFGASPSIQDDQNVTPLHLAAQKGHCEVLRSLLRESPSLEVRDDLGRTPLWLACENGHLYAADILLQAGAKQEIRDSQGINLLVAMLYNTYQPRIAILLLENGARMKSLTDIHAPIKLLQDSVIKGGLVLTSALLRHGLSHKASCRNGKTLLHHVVEERAHEVDSSDLIRDLVNCGFEVNATDNKGNTPLHYAKNRIDAAFLLSQGALLEAKNHKGWTPLFYAAYQGELELVNFYLERKANPYDLDNSQQCVIQVAKGNAKSTPSSVLLKEKIRIKPEVMTKISGFLQILIAQCIEVANKQGKNLLLILGETHNEYRAFQVEKLIEKLAKARGIEDLYLEHSSEVVMLAEKDKKILHAYMPFKTPKKLGFTIRGVDNDRSNSRSYDCSEEGLKKRNLRIKKDVEKYARHAILITGSAHLYGLMAESSTQIDRKRYFVVPFCLSFQDDLKEDSEEFCIHFLTKRQNVIQITENGFHFEQAKATIQKWNSEQEIDLSQRCRVSSGKACVKKPR